MSIELNLRFPDAESVIVRLGADDDGSRRIPFQSPLSEKDLRELRWYIEAYGTYSLGDPDDQGARRIAHRLPDWGKALFHAVFADREAERRFNAFQDSEEEGSRLLTISAEHPAVLALPWELLHDPAVGGGYLFMENPRISIRRRVAGATGGRRLFMSEAKDVLRLLFVVSRPSDLDFIDPRGDPQAVMDAIDKHAPGRVHCEFLRPPTLQALVERLEDKTKPPIDVIHFDGHGDFNRTGDLPETTGARASFPERGDRYRDARFDPSGRAGIGYLLFENEDGTTDHVSAERLGANLHRHRVSLVILSACRSAMIGDQQQNEDSADARPLGTVAARLTATGIPSVLAMTFSVLVPTTRALFGKFYEELARHRGIGEALDNARRYLANHPVKYEVQRGAERVPLRLYDWFLPALYQPGVDAPLLRDLGSATPKTDVVQPRSNLRDAPSAGFFGRRRELWNIESWFAGPTKRITISGFGGQGKTALAEEAAHWLTRIGMFDATVFVDFSTMQGIDAVSIAVNSIGAVLQETLIDAAAATRALEQTATLVILDNLETLGEKPLRDLLDAAIAWSEANGSRVLCTTRRRDLPHPRYGQGTDVHRTLVLEGLGNHEEPDDTMEWFAALSKLPPTPSVPPHPREELIELFDRVDFHPLSIRVLSQQLKTRRATDLGHRLEELLRVELLDAGEGAPASLLASIRLSMDQLEASACESLPTLGVFQGGAFEDDLLAVMQSQSIRHVWPRLRRQLENAALIQVEHVPDIASPFIRFHPTLAPMLWHQLSEAERSEVGAVHRWRYFEKTFGLLAEEPRDLDRENKIIERDLSNLLHAAHGAFDVRDAFASAFAMSLIQFLDRLSLIREIDAFAERLKEVAGEAGSLEWITEKMIEAGRLLDHGRFHEASEVYRTMLQHVDESRAHLRAEILLLLARCFVEPQPAMAVQHLTEAAQVFQRIAHEPDAATLGCMIHGTLGSALVALGRYPEARKALQRALSMANDRRMEAVIRGELGKLEWLEGKLDSAEQSFLGALKLFQGLNEPGNEAAMWHQLGCVYSSAERWDDAERHFREAARINGELGMLSGQNGAARDWSEIAIVNDSAGRPEIAESWFRKVIDVSKTAGDTNAVAAGLINVAVLIAARWAERIPEARNLVEEALALVETLDSSAEAIWRTYGALAEIEERDAARTADPIQKRELLAKARAYRLRADQAKLVFAGDGV